MIVAIRHDQGQRGEALDELGPALGPRKTLQKFLQDETGRQKSVADLDGPHQRSDFGLAGWRVTPERKGPDARVDEEAHVLLRSAL